MVKTCSKLVECVFIKAVVLHKRVFKAIAGLDNSALCPGLYEQQPHSYTQVRLLKNTFGSMFSPPSPALITKRTIY